LPGSTQVRDGVDSPPTSATINIDLSVGTLRRRDGVRLGAGGGRVEHAKQQVLTRDV
jgi:hypothetical protein